MADWQNLDPEAAREAEKYENPIPSRELILAHLSERGAPATRSQLLDEFGLAGEEPEEALRRRLRAMERDGQLIYTRRGAYAPVDKLDLIRGRISGHRDGFGFLIPDDGSDDLFLSPTQMRLVFDGDRALARVSGHDRRGRREGQLVEVIERAHEIVVGRYFEESGIGVVVADNPKIQQEVLIPPGKAGKARHNQFVQVRIEQWPSIHRQAQGEIVEVLGDYMAPGMEIEVALRSYDIPHVWPAAVEKEAAKLKPEVAEKDKEKRVDLRQVPFVTIDGEDARDFDDAVYAEAKRGGGWRLFVAIADVSHYVKVGSALDEEAARRGNSVYFPERVIPMLPEVLSNGLCSLNPLVDRLAMVCEMTLSKAGKLTGYQFYEAVIHSHARLTYTKVSQLLEHPDSVEAENLRQQLPGVVPHLQQLYALYKALLAGRHVRGAIDFETQETRIVFGADRKISEIRPTQRNDAHRLIEECMLCANVATARFLQKHAIPALYRVHDGPPQEKLNNLRQFLGELGLSLGRGKAAPTPGDYQELLEKIHDRADFRLIQTVMLRSLSQAVYSPDNNGHFGLNYDAYTHFTSPIRRYPDLLVHRAIRSVIRSKAETPHVQRAGAASMPKARIYPYDELRLDQLGEQCSMTERRGRRGHPRRDQLAEVRIHARAGRRDLPWRNHRGHRFRSVRRADRHLRRRPGACDRAARRLLSFRRRAPSPQRRAHRAQLPSRRHHGSGSGAGRPGRAEDRFRAGRKRAERADRTQEAQRRQVGERRQGAEGAQGRIRARGRPGAGAGQSRRRGGAAAQGRQGAGAAAGRAGAAGAGRGDARQHRRAQESRGEAGAARRGACRRQGQGREEGQGRSCGQEREGQGQGRQARRCRQAGQAGQADQASQGAFQAEGRQRSGRHRGAQT
ncbi:exoribonuclease RNase R [Pseudomonas aeruginosa]|nr:exoribonuclease RNase R [Pseudomonas aeruginosa]